MASEPQETLTTVSHTFGLSEVSASLEALNIEVERKPTVVHHAQTSYSPGASMTPWSPNARDHRRSTQATPLKLKRYALQIWLKVEVGPGYFLPPVDDSYSTDFTLKVLNRAYLGCTGVYLDRGGHMLAFYGRKGSPKAGLIQDVAIEAGHAVREIPTWMGLTAKWRVRCVSLAEAKDILAGCKRLEQETRRRERQYFQERFAPTHQPSGLSVNAAPFQPRAAMPVPRLAEVPRDLPEAGRKGPLNGRSPPGRTTTSSVGKMPSPAGSPYPLTSDDDVTSDGGLVNPSSRRKGKRSRGKKNAIENLRQRSNEATIDFLIWVGTSMSNLAKDWKDELTECELRALQNKVSLNGVNEEIRHVLDSEMAKRDGHLTPQQMYEAVKKYETYVARKRRLDGKGTSTPSGQPKAAGQPSGYKPRFHKTTAFVATAGMPNDESDHPLGEDSDSHEVEPPLKEDEGLYFPSYLEEAIPDDPALQVKVARTLRVQEMNSRRCYTCNRPGHFARDHQEWEEKIRNQAPPVEGASHKQNGPGEGQAKTPSARMARPPQE